MTKKTLITITFSLVSYFFMGQFSDIYMEYSSKYPDQSHVQLKAEKKINVSLVDGEVVVNYHMDNLYMRLHQEKKIQMRDRIYFSDFRKVDNVKASVFNYNKGKYKEEKVKDFTIKDEMTDHFYDDQKSINFTYPGVHSGSKTSLSYDVTIDNPRFFGSIHFANYFPIKNFYLEVVVDNRIAIDFLMMNSDSLDFDYIKTDKGKNTVYSWKIEESPAFPYNYNSLDPRYTFPHIIPIVKYYVDGADTTQVMESTQDLYDWYQSLVSGINQNACDNNLSLLVDSLTLDLDTDLDKVKSIYYWTQQNIKYVAFENGLGGFIPREANDVFNKKYGDCKDNSSILHQMMKEAGIECQLTWIGTRDIPYSYDEVHTPVVDNHMIITYIDGEDVYFLDATGRFLNLNMPSSFIQGKEALVAINEKDYKIIEVPIVVPELNNIFHQEEIVISKDSLLGRATRTYSGYEKIDLFNYLERATTKEELNSYFTSEFQSGNNSFCVDNIEETNKYNYEEDYSVSYSYVISNHVREIGNSLYVNLNLHQGDVLYLKSDPPFETPIKYDHQYLINYSSELILPQNYSVKSMPENLIIQNDLCDVFINYEIDGTSIKYTQEFKTKFLALDIKQQKELQGLLKKIQKKYKDTVVLELNE